MQTGPRARFDSPILRRGALLKFQSDAPSSPQPFEIQTPGPRGSRIEAVAVFDDYDIKRRDLLGLRCKSKSDDLICWLRREGDAFRIIRVDPRSPSVFR